MAAGLLSILSIGFPMLIVGVALSIPLARRRVAGAWMAVVGASIPLAVFSLQGILSPDCASGASVVTPSGDQRFTCDVTQARTERLPILVVSAIAMVSGLAAFLRSQRRGEAVDGERQARGLGSRDAS